MGELCIVGLMERVYDGDTVERLMDRTDLSDVRAVRRVTLRRSGLNCAICRGEVLRLCRITPSAAALATDGHAVLVARIASLNADLVRRLY